MSPQLVRYGAIPAVAAVVWIITDAIERGVPSVDVIMAAVLAVVVIVTLWNGVEQTMNERE